jgi:elongation factor 1-beta
MAKVIITLKIMPDSPSANLKSIEAEAKVMIEKFGGNVGKVEIEPIAFGLKAINIIFISDESKGGTEELESKVMEIDGVNSVEVSDVRRAIG